MAELPERDAALLLDMLLAARDARAFVKGLDEAAFLASWLDQNAAIRSLEVLGEAAGKISVATQAAHPEIAGRNHRDAPSPHPRLRRGASRSCLGGASRPSRRVDYSIGEARTWGERERALIHRFAGMFVGRRHNDATITLKSCNKIKRMNPTPPPAPLKSLNSFPFSGPA
jgi:Protein of unknown function DUF86